MKQWLMDIAGQLYIRIHEFIASVISHTRPVNSKPDQSPAWVWEIGTKFYF